MIPLLVFALIFFLNLNTLAADMTADQMKNFYQQTLDPGSYNKHIRPNQGIKPVDVSVSMYLMSALQNPDSYIDVDVTFYFRQRWNDSRLAHRGSGDMIGSADLMDKIWIPDSFFPNSKGGKTLQLLKSNAFVKISPNGEVLVSVQRIERFNCPHTPYMSGPRSCSIEIESYGHSVKDIVFKWKEDGAFSVDQTGSFGAGYNLYSKMETLKSGTYSRIYASFEVGLHESAYQKFGKSFVPLIPVTALSFATYLMQASLLRAVATMSSFLSTSLLVVILNKGLTDFPRTYTTSFDILSLTCIALTIVAVVHELMDVQRGSNERGKGIGPASEANVILKVMNHVVRSAYLIANLAVVCVAGIFYCSISQ